MRFLCFNDAAYVLPLPLTNDLLARVVFFLSDSASGRTAEYCDERVCLSASISPVPQPILHEFLCILPP